MLIVYNISIENIHLKPKPENNKNGILTFLDFQMQNWTQTYKNKISLSNFTDSLKIVSLILDVIYRLTVNMNVFGHITA